MIGYITIKGVMHDGHEGVMLDCKIRGVSLRDKFLIMQSIEKALGVNHVEFMAYVVAKEEGVLDKDMETIELKRGDDNEG